MIFWAMLSSSASLEFFMLGLHNNRDFPKMHFAALLPFHYYEVFRNINFQDRRRQRNFGESLIARWNHCIHWLWMFSWNLSSWLKNVFIQVLEESEGTFDYLSHFGTEREWIIVNGCCIIGHKICLRVILKIKL